MYDINIVRTIIAIKHETIHYIITNTQIIYIGTGITF